MSMKTSTLNLGGSRHATLWAGQPGAIQVATLLCLLAPGAPALAQSFHVTCPTATITHPNPGANNSEPLYTGPTTWTTLPANGNTGGYQIPTGNVNGAIKCQQVSGGDGYATMADGTQLYTFSFGPLSGLADIANGLPGTQYPNVFNTPYLLTSNGTVAGVPPSYSGAQFDATAPMSPGYPAGGLPDGTSSYYNGAIGLSVDVASTVNIYQIQEGVVYNTGSTTSAWVNPANTSTATYPNDACTVMVVLNNVSPFKVGDTVYIAQGTATSTANDLAGYTGAFTVTGINPPTNLTDLPSNFAFTYELPPAPAGYVPPAAPPVGPTNPQSYCTNSTAGTPALALVNITSNGTASTAPVIDGHVDPRQIMDIAVMNGNSPAPLKAIDEDDEFFDTLTNVGMIMRPDLFEQHTIHFHGYPNASSFYDGVPDASVAIWIGASFSYYYLAPDAGTYFWHCHITPPEHLQMGMVGQLYVRPRQNRIPTTNTLYQGLVWQQADLRTACNNGGTYLPTTYSGTAPYVVAAASAVSAPVNDIVCTNPLPAAGDSGILGGGVSLVAAADTTPLAGGSVSPTTGSPAATKKYAYNDGDGSTYYDVEYPIQIMGYDPNFHFVGMTFNTEPFADMKDKYFLINGRGYPDTVNSGTLNSDTAGGAPAFTTPTSDGVQHFSQPMNALINIPQGGRALLRISDLAVSEYHTLQSLGIPMQIVAYNAKLLRDQAGNSTMYYTSSYTLGGGEALDAILDTCIARTNPADPSSACTTPLPKGTYYFYTSNLDHLSNDAENFGGQMTEVHVN